MYQVILPYQTFPSSAGALHNIYDFLIGKDRKTGDEETSHIASSWSMASDGRSWTFTLKEGIPFYNHGRASEAYIFNAEDVRHTWLVQSGVLSDKAFNAYSQGPPFKDVNDIVVDGNVATWKLDVIDPEFNIYLSDNWNFGIISKKYWDDVGGEGGYEVAPIGNGAFSFVDQIVGSHILLEGNVDHYRHEPYFAELEFLWVEQLATRAAMLLAEEVHIGQMPNDIFHLVDHFEQRGLKIAKSSLPSVQIVGLIPWYLPEALDGAPTPNYDANAPTRDKRVREALNLAIDRNTINDVFFGEKPYLAPSPTLPSGGTSSRTNGRPSQGPLGRPALPEVGPTRTTRKRPGRFWPRPDT